VKYYEKRGSEIKTPTILEGLDEALFEKVTVLDGELDSVLPEGSCHILIRYSGMSWHMELPQVRTQYSPLPLVLPHGSPHTLPALLDGELDPLFDENINAIAIRVETDDYGNVENIERYPKVGDTLRTQYSPLPLVLPHGSPHTLPALSQDQQVHLSWCQSHTYSGKPW